MSIYWIKVALADSACVWSYLVILDGALDLDRRDLLTSLGYSLLD